MKKNKKHEDTYEKISNNEVSIYRKIFHAVGRFLAGLIVGLAVFLVVGTGIFAAKYRPELENYRLDAQKQLQGLEMNNFEYLSDSEVYDKHGQLIGKISSNGYEYKTLDEISNNIIKGYVAVEDKRFYVHDGIDYKGITRAAVSLVKNRGHITQGGSTITQQVLKNNVIGTQENKYKRKVKEIIMAKDFEEMFGKDKIMEFYLNTNFYGNQCYGVEAASQYYFGKPAKDIDLHESAFLVGLSNAPSLYNPRTNPDKSKAKTEQVLAVYRDDGIITLDEYNKFMAEPLEFVYQRTGTGLANSLVQYSVEESAKALIRSTGLEYAGGKENSISKEDYTTLYSNYVEIIKAGGFKINTTLDLNKQNTFQELFEEQFKGYTAVAENGKFELQGAAVLINNKTGGAETVIGGRDRNDEYNRGFRAVRQPGSAIKPLLVYGPAFDTGKYFPSRIMEDRQIPPVKINGKDYSPSNAYRGYMGDMPLRDAVARSTNTIPYEILEEISPSHAMTYLDNMNFRKITDEDRNNLVTALGGFAYGASPMEMAKGFSTLANDGKYIDNTLIQSIEYQFDTNKNLSIMTENSIKEYLDENNEIMKKYHVVPANMEKKKPKEEKKEKIFNKIGKEEDIQVEDTGFEDGYKLEVFRVDSETGKLDAKHQSKLERQVYRPETAYMTLSTMMDSVNKPFGTSKSARIKKNIQLAGKTGTTNDQKDAWFVGVTPDYTLCVWIGYDQPKTLGFYGGGKSVDIWNVLMKSMYDDLVTEEFVRPEGVVYKYTDSDGLPTETNTGKQDIFNGALMEEINKEMEEIRKERKLKEEEELAESLYGEIDNLEETLANLGEEYSAIEITNLKEGIQEKINSLSDEDVKMELNSKLSGVWNIKSKEINTKREIEQEGINREEDLVRIEELRAFREMIITTSMNKEAAREAFQEKTAELGAVQSAYHKDEYNSIIRDINTLIDLLPSELDANTSENFSNETPSEVTEESTTQINPNDTTNDTNINIDEFENDGTWDAEVENNFNDDEEDFNGEVDTGSQDEDINE